MPRETHIKLLEMLDDGRIDANQLARDLLGWLSSDDVTEFAHANGYLTEDEDEDTDEDDDGEI